MFWDHCSSLVTKVREIFSSYFDNGAVDRINFDPDMVQGLQDCKCLNAEFSYKKDFFLLKMKPDRPVPKFYYEISSFRYDEVGLVYDQYYLFFVLDLVFYI